MPTPIQNLSSLPLLPSLPAGKTEAPQGGRAPGASLVFQDFLLRSIGEVNSMQTEADQAVEKLVTGGDVTPAAVLTAVQKADIAFDLMLQVRNKMIDAFQEIEKLQV
jgi:flagellar hook-basal body complex protein FliE